ncbi:hypothetical protein B7494_g133 [Chlorociboria aeruginascens]|nr:hypothetical protein B7494_g133 [Chlorociboria aeruginascens]
MSYDPCEHTVMICYPCEWELRHPDATPPESHCNTFAFRTKESSNGCPRCIIPEQTPGDEKANEEKASEEKANEKRGD